MTNSVRHSGSAAPGGQVAVTVITCGGSVRMEVAELGGDSVPVRSAVDVEADRRGYDRGGGLAVTWFGIAGAPHRLSSGRPSGQRLMCCLRSRLITSLRLAPGRAGAASWSLAALVS
jgi:hypothetical protein